MTSKTTTFSARLFYSYCHRDKRHKADMEKSLSLLRRDGFLTEWSDQLILPGQRISTKVRKEMDRADILVFLLSQDFIASDECMTEWDYAKGTLSRNRLIFRIPIIVDECGWKDFLGSDDIKALPKDGKPVTNFDNISTPWNQVYEGLKNVIDHLRNNFTPRQEFLNELDETEFFSQKNIRLEDIFIFPILKCYPPQTENVELIEDKITSEPQLLDKKHALIHGEEMSGKTALCRHLFLYLCRESAAVLFLDLGQVVGRFNEKLFLQSYQTQFNGDYALWKRNPHKTLILDNLSPVNHALDLVAHAKDIFDRIVAVSSSDHFYSYFKDEPRLAEFHEMSIDPLTHVQQERLIRTRLTLLAENRPVSDGLVDQIEGRVNSIIISNKIVPRYPFFVLSILQTYEAFMPDNLSISSYGHCYHALILANLIKAGISRSDNDINVCFNFAEQLAFRLYQHDKMRSNDQVEFDFASFVMEYNTTYIMPESILNRLKHDQYGILAKDRRFKAIYMYYFFLGRFLSKDRNENAAEIERLCDQSYVRSNHLILLFIIHHTNNIEIIDDILLRTMCTLDDVAPAVLDRRETKRFARIIGGLPKKILSDNSVHEERQKEREELDRANNDFDDSDGSRDPAIEQPDEHPANDMYRILKCNKVLGQILRNQYGALERKKIEEIVEAIADGGLRLVNWVLKDENEIRDLAEYIRHKYSDYDDRMVENAIRWISFVWTMINIENAVSAINVPEIRGEVSRVVDQKATPAYDLVGYFSHLDSASALSPGSRKRLASLLKKHDDPFVKSVLSIRTQHYMNTHSSKAMIEQSICSLLNIEYVYRPGRLE